jgi:drug/metabolite transporter (DMT)-like permease
MMRRGESSRVASLFYLIPGTTALMGWIVLGERIGLLSICGFAVTAGAVYLCTRTKQP